jgi:hypothetical protein
MKKINELAGRELVWVQPARLKEEFELRAGDEVIATLRWQRSSLAIAETADQSWTFKREGFWHPRVTVRIPGSDDNIATFQPGWAGGGTLDLDPGKQLRFGAPNFWHSQWDWLDPHNQPLVHFKSHQGLLKVEGEVAIEPAAIKSPDMPLLVVLGWYLLVPADATNVDTLLLFARDAADSLEDVSAA